VKFPCILPVYQGIESETGSQQTASSATESPGFAANAIPELSFSFNYPNARASLHHRFGEGSSAESAAHHDSAGRGLDGFAFALEFDSFHDWVPLSC
jgi:hypothetical protein